ncbi:DUF4252 domain-containing protein [Maribacter halichondriae]|uniref:DUF4252 domain-containing protein n=1 Tax=Maribacter halichondriae TaxID=2980554 RepID=UPI00235A2331|nr:DUF4252 domain-containing protein [Maribacter sp. Hal144]
MKTLKSIIYVFVVLAFTACSSTQSLQEYYVDNSENPNFLKLDVPTSVLNLEKADLTDTQRDALGSLKKLNILAFKKTNDNAADFKIEKANVKAILSDNKFIQLMKMNTSYGRATIKYLGTEDAIDEVIIYGDSDEKGFALIRVLGDNMNPAHMMQLLQAIEKSDYDGEGLKDLGKLFQG